jgi:hypothetical protein
MSARSEIHVTLSDDLLDDLQTQARLLRVPLRWMVASLVCDTIESSRIPDPVPKVTPASARA